MGLFQSQNRSYLTASSNYAIDFATAQVMAANAYGAKQDIQTQRLYDLLGLSQGKSKEEAEKQKMQALNQIGLVVVAGAIVAIILYFIFK